MKWTVVIDEEFEPEFEALSVEVQDELYAEAGYVEKFGPGTARPHVDTLKGSRYANMRSRASRRKMVSGAWPLLLIRGTRAIPLVAGDKSGVSKGDILKD
jgi:hypothetical protein